MADGIMQELGGWMNKRKKVAWQKHRVKAKKAEEKRKLDVLARGR